MKLEEIKVVRDRRITFEFKGGSYAINITNDNQLRLSVIDGGLVIKPMGGNCVIFEEEEVTLA